MSLGVAVSESLRQPRCEWQNSPAISQLGSLAQAQPDDLSREVFGVMGLPLDALDLPGLLQILKIKIDEKTPFLLSTPNVNFLMMSRVDPEFRESLLMSDVCPVDGMPLIWIARLLGIPIKERLSGSDIFDALRSRQQTGRRLNVFLFGGAEDTAETLSRKLNVESDGMKCVGALNPGFGTVEEMSSDRILRSINSGGADLLAVFLSARKAQGWLMLNRNRLEVPVRAQFGATINLQAGKIKRAPALWRRLGFEWLWRIKEEPYLWRRYWSDGRGFLTLLLTQVIPLSAGYHWRHIIGSADDRQLGVALSEDQEVVRVKLSGAAVAPNVGSAIAWFREALDTKKNVVLDISEVHLIDPRFFGLFLMVRKQVIERGYGLTFQGMTPRLIKMFRLNGFEYLLNPGD
jgi:N-acetylglucosaminyldiphosphoundecaprenol N-acetyl-beta-D-mannosaminyltransferase